MNALALPDLAAQINHAHAEVEERIRAAVPHAIRAGELLLQAKAELPHGAFGNWISENCVFSERTAQGYMRLSRILPTLDSAKAQRVAEMPLREAMRELADPRDAATSGSAWETATTGYLSTCRSILNETDSDELFGILPRMIGDLRDLEADCIERRIRAERELGKILRTSDPEIHPVANILPELDGAGYEGLKDSIRELGLINPIWLCDGKIVDGRARYRACKDLGIVPQFQTSEMDPFSLWQSLNIYRCHYSQDQRAMMAADLAQIVAGRPMTHQTQSAPPGSTITLSGVVEGVR